MKDKNTLYDYLCEIKDYRRAQGRKHELPVILVIVLMAIMSGFVGERAMGDFVKKNQKELRKVLKPKKGYLPSYQTIDAVLTELGYERISEKFSERALQENPKEFDHVAIDGKAMKGTVKNGQEERQDFVSIVSAFMTKQKKVIGIKAINNKKESEIPAVKELVEMLGLKGVVFTADAVHCQKQTTKTIIKSGNHYILGVKGNQPKLKKAIKNQVKKKSNDRVMTKEKK